MYLFALICNFLIKVMNSTLFSHTKSFAKYFNESKTHAFIYVCSKIFIVNSQNIKICIFTSRRVACALTAKKMIRLTEALKALNELRD